MPIYTGGCLCGQVRYRAEGEPINQRICHCTLCQKSIGAPFNARVLLWIKDVETEGMVSWVNSSPPLKRGFCAACGTTMFSRRESMGWVGVASGSLDDPSLFKPEMHIFTSTKQDWLKLDDGLPQFEHAPPPA